MRLAPGWGRGQVVPALPRKPALRNFPLPHGTPVGPFPGAPFLSTSSLHSSPGGYLPSWGYTASSPASPGQKAWVGSRQAPDPSCLSGVKRKRVPRTLSFPQRGSEGLSQPSPPAQFLLPSRIAPRAQFGSPQPLAGSPGPLTGKAFRHSICTQAALDGASAASRCERCAVSRRKAAAPGSGGLSTATGTTLTHSARRITLQSRRRELPRPPPELDPL